MPVENGTQPTTTARRGKPITVRTMNRPAFNAAAAQVLEDPNAEPVEDELLDLLDEEAEVEEEVTERVHDDSEELEMWMRQKERDAPTC